VHFQRASSSKTSRRLSTSRKTPAALESKIARPAPRRSATPARATRYCRAMGAMRMGAPPATHALENIAHNERGKSAVRRLYRLPLNCFQAPKKTRVPLPLLAYTRLVGASLVSSPYRGGVTVARKSALYNELRGLSGCSHTPPDGSPPAVGSRMAHGTHT
jgi:hypothetical protein